MGHQPASIQPHTDIIRNPTGTGPAWGCLAAHNTNIIVLDYSKKYCFCPGSYNRVKKTKAFISTSKVKSVFPWHKLALSAQSTCLKEVLTSETFLSRNEMQSWHNKSSFLTEGLSLTSSRVCLSMASKCVGQRSKGSSQRFIQSSPNCCVLKEWRQLRGHICQE